jgi:hypothetical protein
MSFQIRLKLRSKLLAGLAVAVVAATASVAVHAEQLSTPSEASSQADRPARGMSMEKVEATYGAPSRRDPAVGEPPITRWEYPGFVVYFEHQFVIHTVAIG